LDLELRRFDVLIKKAAAAIELLTERRTVLITAAVAGTSNVGYRHASSMQD